MHTKAGMQAGTCQRRRKAYLFGLIILTKSALQLRREVTHNEGLEVRRKDETGLCPSVVLLHGHPPTHADLLKEI